MENSKLNRTEKFLKEFQPPIGFSVPDDFPIMTGFSVLVKKEDRTESATRSGIIIPETTQGVNKYVGRLYAVGNKVEFYQPGMRVLFNAFADQSVLHDNIEYKFMSAVDLFGILPEKSQTVTSSIDSNLLDGNKRKQYSHDEMPDIVDPNQKINDQETKELADQFAEKLKKDAGRKTHAMPGSAPEGN